MLGEKDTTLKIQEYPLNTTSTHTSSMDTVQQLHQLQQVVNTFYGASDTQAKASANAYLQEFQRSPTAWDVLFTVLEDPNADKSLRMFIAQTLRQKVQYDYGQLPNESAVQSLRLTILEVLLSRTDHSKDKPLITQVAIALAYLAIQDFSWESPVMDVMNYLSANPVNLLELLKILPEEFSEERKLPLTHEEYQTQYDKLIRCNAENVYYVLIQSANAVTADNKDLEILILDCIKSWIDELPIHLILGDDSILWKMILAGFQDPQTFDTSVDCLITIVNQIDIFDNLQDNVKYIEKIYQQLINLKPLIQESWDDPMTMERITELFSSTGEAWHSLIVKDPSSFQLLVEILLQLTNYDEDLETVKYTFKFWYELKSMLVLKPFKESKQFFKPTFESLMEILIGHLKYPTTSTSTNVSELFGNDKASEDSFKDSRYEIGDVLKDCCQIIGQYDALNIPFAKLKQLIGSGDMSQVRWQDIECLLFCIRSMAKEVSKNESEIMPQIMNYLIQLPENPKIRYAATLVLGRYTEWTNLHPDFLQVELNYIIEGFKLDNSSYTESEKMEIIMAATHALKYFCVDCKMLLIDYLEPLYNLFSNLENHLDFESLFEIVYGLSYVLARYMERNLLIDEPQCLNLIKMFWGSTIEKLKKYNELDLKTLAQMQEVESIDVKIANTIEVLSMYVEEMRAPSEFLETQRSDYIVSTFVMQEVLPVICTTISKFGSSSKVSERGVKFIRKSIQTFNRFLLPCAKDIETLLLEGFQKYKFGCYLWCSGALIQEVCVDNSDETQFISISDAMLADVWQFTHQQINNFFYIYEQTPTEMTGDIVEDFFRMMSDVLMFKPLEMLNDFETVEHVYAISLDILEKYNEKKIIDLDVTFLIDLLSWSMESPALSVEDNVPNVLKYKVYGLISGSREGELVVKFLNYSILKFDEEQIYSAIELLMQIFDIYRLYQNGDAGMKGVNTFLSALPSELITEGEKLKFYGNLQTSFASKNLRKMRSTLADFIHWYKRKIVNRA
jgi:transportin-3